MHNDSIQIQTLWRISLNFVRTKTKKYSTLQKKKKIEKQSKSVTDKSSENQISNNGFGRGGFYISVLYSDTGAVTDYPRSTMRSKSSERIERRGGSIQARPRIVQWDWLTSGCLLTGVTYPQNSAFPRWKNTDRDGSRFFAVDRGRVLKFHEA